MVTAWWRCWCVSVGRRVLLPQHRVPAAYPSLRGAIIKERLAFGGAVMRGLVAAGFLFAAFFILPPVVAAAPLWKSAIPGVPPGGFATITVEGVRHGDRRMPPDLRLRVRSDKERAAILVKLDGTYLTQSDAHSSPSPRIRSTSPSGTSLRPRCLKFRSLA